MPPVQPVAEVPKPVVKESATSSENKEPFIEQVKILSQVFSELDRDMKFVKEDLERET